MDRPILVALIAIIMGVIGAIALVVGMLFLMSQFVSYGSVAPILQWVGSYVIFAGPLIGAVLSIGGAAVLVIALGLWHQEYWALIVCIAAILIGETVLFFEFVPFSYIFIGLLVLYVYLLAIRQHFHK